MFSVTTILPWYKGYKTVSKAFNGAMLGNLMAVTFPGGLGEISVFILGFCIILIVAYLSGSSEIKRSFEYLTWLITAFFILFFAFAHANPYWIVMLAPFLALIMFNRGENLKINIILEIVAEVAMILVQGYFYEQSFSYLIFKNTDIKLGQGAENIVDVMEFLGVSGYIP